MGTYVLGLEHWNAKKQLPPPPQAKMPQATYRELLATDYHKRSLLSMTILCRIPILMHRAIFP